MTSLPTALTGPRAPASAALAAVKESVLTETQETRLERIGQALAPWQNVLIEGATLLVIGVSALITAKFFGWGSTDWVVDARAAVFAFGVDIAYYIAVTLTRISLTGRYWSRGWAVFWIAWALFWGAFSWMNNLFFVAGFWQLQPEALARTGIPEWVVLHVGAGVPQAIVVMMAFVPRHHERDTRTPAQKYQEQLQQLEEKAYQADIRRREAELRGKNLRQVAAGYLSGKSEEERAVEAQAAEAQAAKAAQEQKLREVQLVAWGEVLRELAEKHEDELDLSRFTGDDEATLRRLARWLRLRGEAVPSLESMRVLEPAPSSPTPTGTSTAVEAVDQPSPVAPGSRRLKTLGEIALVEPGAKEAGEGLSFVEAADLLHMTPNTLRYYASDRYTGTRKITPEDLLNGQLLRITAVMRLKRIIEAEEKEKARSRGTGQKTAKLGGRGDSQGRLPAITGAALNGNAGRSEEEAPPED